MASISLTPSQAVAYAGAVQNGAMTAPGTLGEQGAVLYAEANAYAASGGASNGNLSSTVLAAGLVANNLPSGSIKTAIVETVGAVAGAVATFEALTTATGWLVSASAGFLAAGGAFATAVPIFGTAVAAMIAADEIILKNAGASSPTQSEPGLAVALLSVAQPSPATQQAQGIAASSSEPPLFDATQTMACGFDYNPSAGSSPTLGAALIAWRDFLDFEVHGSQPASYQTSDGGDLYPPAGASGGSSGFSAPYATYQDAADTQYSCLAYAMGGQPNALRAIGLALRWVPIGDPWVAPYTQGFAGTNLAGWISGLNIQSALLNLAVTFAQWPVAYADQQALAYLTSVAWVWQNYPGNTLPLPAYLTWKIGFLKNLVAQDGLLAAASAPATNAGTSGTVAAGVVALAAAPALWGLATGRGALGGWRALLSRLRP